MATGDSEAVTLGQFKAWAATQAGGVQFVELFSGSASTVTLPQSYDSYRVLFTYSRTNDGAASGVCIPPDNVAYGYDGKNHVRVSFSGDQAVAPYLYTIERIYAIA